MYQEIKNQTYEDAVNRMNRARLGCTAYNPTKEYLLELRNQAEEMIRAIDRKLDEQDGARVLYPNLVSP